MHSVRELKVYSNVHIKGAKMKQTGLAQDA
jgi:hypothetical protein